VLKLNVVESSCRPVGPISYTEQVFISPPVAFTEKRVNTKAYKLRALKLIY